MPSKYFAAAALVFLCAACTASSAGEPIDMASDPAVSDGSMAPMFEVDPFWPKPLPNHWLLGSTIGVGVDSRDHVWIIHRGNLANNEIPAALDPPLIQAAQRMTRAAPVRYLDGMVSSFDSRRQA